LRCGGIFIANLLSSVPVKDFLKIRQYGEDMNKCIVSPFTSHSAMLL